MDAIASPTPGRSYCRRLPPGMRAATEATRLRVAYRVGMAPDWNGVPEMLRHGIVRLAAQYYLRRGESGEIEVPAAVTALWRPWRRLRLN